MADSPSPDAQSPLNLTAWTQSTSTFPFYVPSFDLAVVGIVVFTGLAALHTALSIKTRTVYLTLLPKAAMMMAAGMVLRLVLSTNTAHTVVFIVMSVLLSVSGSLLGISLMMTYTRLVWWITPRQHRDTATLWLPPAFHTICLCGAQMVGDSLILLGSGLAIRPAPAHLATVGALLDMLVWGVFSALVIRFMFISRRRRWAMDRRVQDKSMELGMALSVASVLLSIRGVMQVLEKDAMIWQINHPSGNHDQTNPPSVVLTDEWPTYVFDLLPDALILLIVVVYFPGIYLPRPLLGFWYGNRGPALGELETGSVAT
ncbi:hypothetical protein B0T22DRAFT_476956 [Podospora appendiculata]|uniref:Uncharacterized protein n=1 Tax=Podospora appendiculata TaxID=314037 RepID=A0AAE0XIW2_9PEZI|nr:hypothetical protein B0T22DRAFT_476956 [Podospora appendiculata]